MIALKKLYGDELLRLALVLSLLKVDPNDYLEQETQQLLSGLHISNGSDWSAEHEARTLIRPRFVHPKNLDNILINYERELFDELNSLGRYADYNYNVDNSLRINPILHTYLLNNVATDSVAPALATQTVDEAQDGVSADDNVAQEVKITDEDDPKTESDTDSRDSEPEIKDIEAPDPPEAPEPEQTEERTEERAIPDAVVTLSVDFLKNHTEADIFAEIATRSFDVNELLVQPKMQIKKEVQDQESELLDINIKKEPQNDDLYSDNAIDDFVPYFTAKSERFELGEANSVFHQNMADLKDYEELFDDVKELRNNFECIDMKQQEDLEQYLIENTPLDTEVYELAPMFEEELVLGVKRERASTSFTSASSSGVSEMDMCEKDIKSEMESDEGHHTGDELTQEDMDLIEVLWKQDVDMGFSLEDPMHPEGPLAKKVELTDEIDKELEEKIQRSKEEKEIEAVTKSLLVDQKDDPWAGLSYTVDTETGEYVLQGDLPGELVGESRFDLLEEALQLAELGDDAKEEPEVVEEASSSGIGSGAGSSGSGSDAGGAMLHPAMRPVPHHPLALHHNQSLMRSMSVEQRWQDLASLLTIPPPPPPDQYHQHYHHNPHHNISAHGPAAAGYPPNYHHPHPHPHPHVPIPPVPEKHPDAYAGAAAPLEGAYKVESAHQHQQHDGLYYQNSTEMAPPPTQDGFLQSILNDEDLQLMDMAMNEGMYTMRMLEGAGHPPHSHNHTHMMMAERDSASDSAVSSMGSERVPSLSDGEWCEGSDSAHDYHSSKFRPYDGAAYRDRAAPHQPQKKHHMFGKRCFQEQQQQHQQQQPPLEAVPRVPSGVVKNEWPEHAYRPDLMHNAEFGRAAAVAPPAPALDMHSPHSSHALLQGPEVAPSPSRWGYAGERVRHNHTYSAPHAALHARPAPPRDKRARRLTDASDGLSDGGSACGHSTRDEKRAKALGIPLEVQDIINLPMDEFNERLSKHDLSEAQLSLIRDIRRRGKNKVAAQNCRKRKLDQITSLADEVRTVRERRQRAARDRSTLLADRARLKERFAQLYRHVFTNLRDASGRPLSSGAYSLQQAADGNVVLVPKLHHHDQMNRTSDEEMDRKAQ